MKLGTRELISLYIAGWVHTCRLPRANLGISNKSVAVSRQDSIRPCRAQLSCLGTATDTYMEVAKQQVCMCVSCMLHTMYIPKVQRSLYFQHNSCSAHAPLQLHVYTYCMFQNIQTNTVYKASDAYSNCSYLSLKGTQKLKCLSVTTSLNAWPTIKARSSLV